jgi:hypothetical protein
MKTLVLLAIFPYMTSPQLVKKIGLKQNPEVTDEIPVLKAFDSAHVLVSFQNCFIIPDNFVMKEVMLVVPGDDKESDIAIIDGTSQLDPCKSYANIYVRLSLIDSGNGVIHHPKSRKSSYEPESFEKVRHKFH